MVLTEYRAQHTCLIFIIKHTQANRVPKISNIGLSNDWSYGSVFAVMISKNPIYRIFLAPLKLVYNFLTLLISHLCGY